MLASRFKTACREAGLTIDQVAQTLHVTPRTVRYWFAGTTAVPFAAYKLLRILNRFELPGESWAGWHMHSGRLWTPEGFGFEPVDGLHWSALVRRSRLFLALHAENGFLRCQLASIVRELGGAPEAGAAGGLVSVSTSGLGVVDDGQTDIRLTSQAPAATLPGSNQIDHGLIPCLTHSDCLTTSTPKPASGPQESGSASTPSSAFALMPTSEAGLLPSSSTVSLPRPLGSFLPVTPLVLLQPLPRWRATWRHPASLGKAGVSVVGPKKSSVVSRPNRSEIAKSRQRSGSDLAGGAP